jgi:glycosyltransferase involved in cell wall biosynthesis
MKLIFVTEARFTKDAKNDIYGGASFNLELWKRYLTCFSEVVVMARVNYDENHIGNHNYLSSGHNVSFLELPLYIGPLQYLKKRNQVVTKIKESIDSVDGVFICRIPSTIGGIVIKHLFKNKRPFGVEVVGDPWDVFAPGSVKHLFRPVFRWLGYLNLKRNVSRASGALYVTQHTLQQRYPVSKGVYQVVASNVKIKDALLGSKSKEHEKKKQYTILSIGSLEQMYKAPDVVLKAIKELNTSKISYRLVWLGDGIYKENMLELAKELDISDFVSFKGNVGADEVRKELLEADIFVLASRTEGLPRAMIEAMSVGLPCIGTKVGGIPELLTDRSLIPKDNYTLLVEKIRSLIDNSEYYNDESLRNLMEADKYKESLLNQKRMTYYKYLISLYSILD